MSSVKKYTVSKADLSSVQHMFNQLFGIDAGDPHIYMKKFEELDKQLLNVVKVIKIILNLRIWANDDSALQKWLHELRKFQSDVNGTESELRSHIEECEKLLQEHHLKTGLMLLTNDQSSLSSDKFNGIFSGVKQCKIIKQVIITTKNIEPHLTDIDDQNDYFIVSDTTPELRPFKFTGLDIKHLWLHCNLPSQSKKIIFGVIRKLYDIGVIIHNLLISPNIDIKQFSAMVIEAITSYETALPRCKDAFDVIRKSITILEDKFEDFYKDAMKANDPSLIFQLFFGEVSNKYEKKKRLYMQIMQICNYMRKQISDINDPELRSVIGNLENNLSFFDKFDDTDFDDIEVEAEIESPVVEAPVAAEIESPVVEAPVAAEVESPVVEAPVDEPEPVAEEVMSSDDSEFVVV